MDRIVPDNSEKWPLVTIVICTYNRPLEVRKTIQSLLEHVYYPPNRLRWHIADDGTDGFYVGELHDWMIEVSPESCGVPDSYPRTTYTITPRKGWGTNVNTALREVKTDYVYFTEDDYVLKRDMDLMAYVAAMEEAPAIGMMRFGIAGHALTCHLNEIDIRKWDPIYEDNEGLSQYRGYGGTGKLNTWVVDKGFSHGPYSFYLYSNRPHLKHRRFHEAYGYYVEGQTLANTEHAMNHQFRQGPEVPYIACPANWTLWHYDHIGVSRQGTSEDVHATA